MRGGVCPQEHFGKSRTPPIGVNVLTFLDLLASIMPGSLVTSHLDLCTNDVRKNPGVRLELAENRVNSMEKGERGIAY